MNKLAFSTQTNLSIKHRRTFIFPTNIALKFLLGIGLIFMILLGSQVSFGQTFNSEALHFDTPHPSGSNDFGSFYRDRVSMGDNYDIGTELTISIWIKPEKKFNISTIFGKKKSGSQNAGYSFYVNEWQTENGAIVMEGRNSTVSSTTSVTWGEWQHVAYVMKNNEVEMYFNGVEQPVTYDGNLLIEANSYDFRLGQFPSGSAFNYLGAMDELRIWSKALTCEEVYDVFRGIDNPGTTTNVMGYYDFNNVNTPDAQNTVLKERSGNGPDGTLEYFDNLGTAETTSNWLSTGLPSDNLGVDCVFKVSEIKLTGGGTYELTPADLIGSFSEECGITSNLLIGAQILGQKTYTCSDIGQVIDLGVRVTDANNQTGECFGSIIITGGNSITAGISSSDSDNSINVGESVTFTATPSPSSGITYNFLVNGTSAQNGSSNTFTTTSLSDQDDVKVIVINSGACAADVSETIKTTVSGSISNFEVQGLVGSELSNYLTIANGDLNPATTDGTDGGLFASNLTKYLRFRVLNNSTTTDLNITNVSISGANAAEFSIQGSPSFTVFAGPVSTASNRARGFALELTPTNPGVKTALVTITTNDPVTNTFTYQIQAEAGSAPSLKMVGIEEATGTYGNHPYFPFTIVSNTTILIPSASVITGRDFLDVKIDNDSRCISYTVENEGNADLVFSGAPSIIGKSMTDFSITQNLTDNTLSVGEKNTIKVCYNPSVVEQDSAIIKLTSNDATNPDLEVSIIGLGIDNVSCKPLYSLPYTETGWFMTATNGNTIWAVRQAVGGASDKRLFKSIDAGATWTTTEPTAFSNSFFPSSINYEASSNLLVIGTGSAGVYISTDGGGTFVQTNSINGLLSQGIYLDGNVIYGNAQANSLTDKLVKSSNNGQSFSEVSGSPAGVELIWASGNDIYVVNRVNHPDGSNSAYYNLHQSTNGGSSFTKLNWENAARPGVLKVVAGKIYIGVRDGEDINAANIGLNISEDGGNTFTQIPHPGGISDDIEDLLVSGDTIYLVTEDNNNGLPGFAYSYDHGASWGIAITGERQFTNFDLSKIGHKAIVGGYLGIYECSCEDVIPSVTINQADGQADPATTSPINFTVVFSESVTDFATGDVTFSGTAGGTLVGAVTGGGSTYNVAVSGMTSSGTVVANIAAGVATNSVGNNNLASTSTDNSVTFNLSSTNADIDVRGWDGNGSDLSDYVSIVNNDMTPSTADGTDAGLKATNFDGYIFFHVFNTSNTTDLNVTSVTVSGPDAAIFEYIGTQSFTVAARNEITTPWHGRSLGFKTLQASSGVKMATITITSDDPDESPFVFNIQVEHVDGPVLEMKGFSDHSGLNSDSDYFPYSLYSPTGANTNPSVAKGTNLINVKVNDDSRCSYFTIENLGLDDLVFSGNPLVEITGQSVDDFWVARTLRGNTLSPGAIDTIAICYDPNVVEGDTVNVKIPSNDIINPNIDFQIIGTAVEDLMCDFILSRGREDDNLDFTFIAADEATNTIWAVNQKSNGTDKTLYISTDGGQTWTDTEPTAFTDNFAPGGIKYNPSSNLLIINSTSGMYISNDRGATFTLNTSIKGVGNDRFYIDGNTIYANQSRGITSDKLVKSTDNGQTFTEVAGSPDKVEIVWAAGNTIYVVNRNSSSPIYRLHSSTDGGANFTELNFGAEKRPQAITVAGNRIYIGTFGEGLFISEDGGNTFTNQVNPGGMSDDIEDIVVNGDSIYLTTLNNSSSGKPGFGYSYDHGATWQHAIVGEPQLTFPNVMTFNGRIIIGSYGGVAECGCKELQLLGNNVEILDQWNTPSLADHTDFGEVPAGGTVSRTFTLKSLFKDPIELKGSPVVTIEGNDAAQFSVTAQPSDVFLEKDETTTFTIKFDAPANGTPRTYKAIAKLLTTDFTEDTLTFNIQGAIEEGCVEPTITFTSSVNGIICGGTDVTFTATGGANYKFYLNNTIVQNGAANTYTTNTLATGNQVKVVVTDAQNCPVTSNIYTANVDNTDSDGDSVPDCRDVCPGGDDLGPDNDNDMVPDECDCDSDDVNDGTVTASDFLGQITTGEYKAGFELTADKIVNTNNTVILRAGVHVFLKPGFHAKAGSDVHAFIAPCVLPSVLIENDEIVEQSFITLPSTEDIGPTDLTIAPNPFRETTMINFRLGAIAEGSVALYDQTGRQLKFLLSPRTMEVGDYNIQLDRGNLQSGMYLVVLQTANERITKKIMLVQ